jgi:hypothetical protein
MKKILIFIMILIISNFSMAQDTTKVWETGGQIGLNISEVGFYNWAKGGDNNINGTSFLQLFANRNKNDWSWENKLDLEYGLKQENKDILKKTDDRIELNSKIGKQAKEKWFYTGYLNFRSQFSKGYDYDKSHTVAISDLMSPGYLIFGLGMDYKPNKYFSAMISPISSKLIFVLDQSIADTGDFTEGAEYDETGNKIKDGKTFEQELGANIVLTFKKDIFENVNLDTKLDLFSNYLKNPQNVDVDWQTTITMKVNSFLNVIFKTHLIYDDNTTIEWGKDGVTHKSPITQFKQSLAVGLMYKF